MDFDAKICWLDSRKRPQLVEEILRGDWAFTSDRGRKQTTAQLLYKWLFEIFFWQMVHGYSCHGIWVEMASGHTRGIFSFSELQHLFSKSVRA